MTRQEALAKVATYRVTSLDEITDTSDVTEMDLD